MQSGIDTSRLRIAAETTMPTRDTPAPEQLADAAPAAGGCVTAGVQNPTKNACVASNAGTSGSGKDLFGPEGPSFRDVLDALNPLNQIPVVSDILANVTGHEPSTASKIAGGALAALVTGPVAFAATLASVAFEDGAGKTPANAVYAALSGEDAATSSATMQLAQADTAVEPVKAQQLASLEPAAAPEDHALETVQKDVMRAMANDKSSNAVLDLYGNSADSAHASYRKAQLIPYLKDVNHSRVL